PLLGHGGAEAAGDTFKTPGWPMHPVVPFLTHPSWALRLQVLFLAAVAAPIVEETMFRGVLYRHLREASAAWRRSVSVIFSAFVVSFVFAIIHPQGFVAVPLLMALAFGFTLAREWRGSLLAPMVAHGFNNAMILLFLMAIFS